jgi:putative phage-type endonuclease
MSTQERPESGPGDVARSRQVEGAESEPNPSVAMAEIRRGSPVPLGKFTPGSDEWVEVRKTHLGGSEIAAVLGLSPWTSPFSLWHTKAGLIPPTPDSPAMEWGRRLEPVVAAKFCDMHPDFIPLPNSFQGSTFAHHERSWQSASPDLRLTYPTAEYVDGGATFVEIKTSARADSWWDGVPVYYRTQVLWTMDVLGVDTAWLAVLIGGSDYREYPFVLDADAEADLAVMRSAGEEFMASLAENRPPDIDDSWSTYEAVRRLHADIDPDTEYEIDRDLAEAFVSTKRAVDESERAYRKTRTEIARGMGRANYASCDGVRIARRQPTRDGGPPVLVSTRKQLPAREAAA